MASLDLPERAMRQQIASAVNVVIQVSRLGDGTRKMIQISEIVGMEGDVITMQDIFIFERQGIGENEKVLGQFKATGHPAQVRRPAEGVRHRPRRACSFRTSGSGRRTGLEEGHTDGSPSPVRPGSRRS